MSKCKDHGKNLIYCSDCMSEHLRETQGIISVLKKQLDEEGDSKQGFIDLACYYRNLAITCGAKPNQMHNNSDRVLCENWDKLEPHLCCKEIDEITDLWEENEKLSNQLKLFTLNQD
jgi:hypothetical protein